MPNDNSTQERISQKLSPAAATKSKRGVIIAICCTVVVVIAVVAAAIIFLKQSDDVDKRNVIVTPDNVDEVLADLQDKPEATGSYEVMMNTTWEFEKGDSASTNAYVENSTSNTNQAFKISKQVSRRALITLEIKRKRMQQLKIQCFYCCKTGKIFSVLH